MSTLTENIMDVPIGQLVAEDMRRAEVFNKYGIDFCCGGKKTLRESCSETKLDAISLKKELLATDKDTGVNSLAYNEWELDYLSDFIVNTHHTYVKKSLPEIRSYASKVAEKHGNNHAELMHVLKIVEYLNQELTAHMEKEEKILFPLIKNIVKATKRSQSEAIKAPCFVQNPIRVMEAEHEEAGSALKEIRRITQNYLLPDDACTSYALLFKMLEEFEKNLQTHIHLENNILFPKAIKMEEQLFNNSI